MPQIRLQTQADVASEGSGTSVRLKIAETEDGPRWREFRAPFMPPRISQGNVQWGHSDPMTDFVMSQDDWSGGAFEAMHRPNSNKYADSHAIDARWPGVVALAARSIGELQTEDIEDDTKHTEFTIRQGNAGRADAWTAGTGVTVNAKDTASAVGKYAFSLTTDGSRSQDDILFSQNLITSDSPIGQWVSDHMSVFCQMLRHSGSESGIRIEVYDGQGTTTSTGTPAVTSSSYTYKSVTRAVHASANQLVVRFVQTADETGAHVYKIDNIHVNPTSNTVNDRTCVGIVEEGGNYYTAVGMSIYMLIPGGATWRPVYKNTGTDKATDICAFNGNVYVAYGASTAYVYGATTSWTVSTETSPDNKATHFATGKDAAGNETLWKAETTTSVANSPNPINGGTNWTAPITVGSTSHAITGLYNAFDSLLVGKEEGLFKYTRFDPDSTTGDDKFENIQPGYASMPSTDNFSVGTMWNGWFYTATNRGGFIRYRPGETQDMSAYLGSPRVGVTLTNEVKALVASPAELFISLDTLTADDTLTKTTKVVSMVQLKEGFAVHGFSTANLSVPEALGIVGDQLILIGTKYTPGTNNQVLGGHTWNVYSGGRALFAENDSDLQSTKGWLETSVWNGQMPDTPKAFTSFTIVAENMSSTNTITVTYGLDGAAPTTTTLGTFNGSGRVQTLYFHSVSAPQTNAVGRSIQYRLALAQSAVDDDSIRLYSFGAHSTLRPERLRTWEMWVSPSDTFMESEAGQHGYQDPVAPSTKVAAMDTLEEETYPLTLTHAFDTAPTTTTVNLVDRSKETLDGREIYRLVLQEVNTSA